MSATPDILTRVDAVIDGRRDVWDPPPARRAATVALLRAGRHQMEVYLMRRSATMKAAPHVHVFPGGGLAAEDGDPDDEAAVRRAAVREVREETGIALSADDLVRFARWVTPEVMPHRHDTEFFAIGLPEGVEPQLLGTEADSSVWLSPTDALDRFARGGFGLLPPTLAALHQLSAHDDVGDVLVALARLPVPALMPTPQRTDDQVSFRLVDMVGQREVHPSEVGLPPDWQPIVVR